MTVTLEPYANTRMAGLPSIKDFEKLFLSPVFRGFTPRRGLDDAGEGCLDGASISRRRQNLRLSTKHRTVEHSLCLWARWRDMNVKSRLSSKFLNARNLMDANIRRDSYRATLVWQWLQHVKPGTDETGIVLRVLRSRIDMPDRFPHRTYLLNYMLKCKIDSQLATRVVVHVWNMYAAYRDAVLHDRGDIIESTQDVPKDNTWLNH